MTRRAATFLSLTPIILGIISVILGIIDLNLVPSCWELSGYALETCSENARYYKNWGIGLSIFGVILAAGGPWVVMFLLRKVTTVNPVKAPKPLAASPIASETINSTVAATSTEAELQKAKDMLDKGLVDEDEYKELKKKIIERS